MRPGTQYNTVNSSLAVGGWCKPDALTRFGDCFKSWTEICWIHRMVLKSRRRTPQTVIPNPTAGSLLAVPGTPWALPSDDQSLRKRLQRWPGLWKVWGKPLFILKNLESPLLSPLPTLLVHLGLTAVNVWSPACGWKPSGAILFGLCISCLASSLSWGLTGVLDETNLLWAFFSKSPFCTLGAHLLPLRGEE